jgi:hypothetical protein
MNVLRLLKENLGLLKFDVAIKIVKSIKSKHQGQLSKLISDNLKFWAQSVEAFNRVREMD